MCLALHASDAHFPCKLNFAYNFLERLTYFPWYLYIYIYKPCTSVILYTNTIFPTGFKLCANQLRCLLCTNRVYLAKHIFARLYSSWRVSVSWTRPDDRSCLFVYICIYTHIYTYIYIQTGGSTRGAAGCIGCSEKGKGRR